MQISIAFNPAVDTAESVASMVARIYGSGAPATVTIRPEDRPDTGADAGQGGTDAQEPAGGEVSPNTLDKSGIHWDERIHSKPAKINGTDGMYRRRKGVQDTAVASVTAEIKAKLSANAGAAAGLPTPPGAAAPATPSLPTPPAAGPALALPQPPAPAPTPYESFVTWIGGHVAAGTANVTEEWVQAALAQYGVADGKVVNLQTAAPDFIAAIKTGIAGVLGVPAV